MNRMWPDRRRMQVLLLPTCARSARLLRLALWSEATRLGLWSEEMRRRVRNEIRRRRLGGPRGRIMFGPRGSGARRGAGTSPSPS